MEVLHLLKRRQLVMSDFTDQANKEGFYSKLWRGERMTLIGFDVDEPEPDFVGFAIEFKAPGEREFKPLLNRIAFSYSRPAAEAVTGARLFDSREAPFQKFRWVHFPAEPKDGRYRYRVTKRHMRDDKTLFSGTSMELDLSLEQVTYDEMVDVGFTRNFASSQAYREQFGNNPNIIPAESEDGLEFEKLDLKNDWGKSVYE